MRNEQNNGGNLHHRHLSGYYGLRQLSHINRRGSFAHAIQSSKMIRGTRTYAVLSICIGAIAIGQFLPPPPERFGSQRQPPPRRPPPINAPLGPTNDIANGNSILSRAYGGTWFRSNFQDLFSYRGAQKLEWFEVLDGNDCSPVPATVNAGKPPRDICNGAIVEERRCICINTGTKSTDTGYEQICGNCRDPCQLKFTPDRVPRYLQRLAAQEVDNDFNDY